MNGRLVLLCCLIYLLRGQQPRERSFRFKASQEEEERASRFRGKVLPRVMKMKSYFTARPQIDIEEGEEDRTLLKDVPGVVKFNPCATSDELCLNGGTCRNDNGKFYCNCRESHYGKRCELVADKGACEDHLCQNGGVCYTIGETQIVMDRDRLKGFQKDLDAYAGCLNSSRSGDLCARRMANADNTEIEQKDLAIEIRYKCQCKLGYQGVLCDYSKKERLCEEDFCMGHGYPMVNGDACSCLCSPEYTGQHCETLLPCATWPCHNEGVCINDFDAKAGTFTARCNCPDVTGQVTEGSLHVGGEHCEFLNLTNSMVRINPCASISEYFSNITNFENVKKLESGSILYGVSELLCGTNMGCTSQVSACAAGECSVVLGTVNNTYFPLPRCICPPLHFGMWCNEKLTSLCDVTLEERKRNMTEESRCTSLRHGTCVDTNNERRCECHEEFVGERCETFAPCARDPCGPNAECIAIPFEKSDPNVQSYRCICDIGDEQNGNDCVYSGTGHCAAEENPCHHGKCVSCPDDGSASICTEKEANNGFRCVCAPGFAPPFCERPSGACEAHLCENDALCEVNKEYTYDCHCANGTSGHYCESIVDYCLYKGNRECGEEGTCVNSEKSIRHFECECSWNYEGINCQQHISPFMGFYRKFDEHYFITYPASALILCVIIVFVSDSLCGGMTKSVRELRQHKNKTSKGQSKIGAALNTPREHSTGDPAVESKTNASAQLAVPTNVESRCNKPAV